MNVKIVLVLLVSFKILGVIGIIDSEITGLFKNFFAQIFCNYRSGYCGGAIIGKNAVISLKTCVIGDPEDHFIILGSIEYKEGIRYFVYEIRTSTGIDIAIFVLKNNIHFTNSISVLNLPPEDELYQSDIIAMIYGFGVTKEGGKQEQILRKGSVNVIDHDSCMITRHKTNFSVHLFCAYNKGSGTDACTGDEGGPLVYRDQIIGIIGKEVGCSNSDSPTVIIRISSEIKWILETINPSISNNRQQDYFLESCTETKQKFYEQPYSVRNWGMTIMRSNITDRLTTVRDSCFLNPIDVKHVLTSAKCIPDESEFRSFKKSNQLTVTFNEKQYNVDNITFGSEILPYFSDTKHDIAIIKVSEPLQLQSNYISTFNVVSVYAGNKLPSVAAVAKHDSNLNTSSLVPVEIHLASDCMKNVKFSFAFKIVLEMFCVAPKCGNSNARLNACSDDLGAPVFDEYGDLFGIIIWQRSCEENVPLIGLPVAKFIKVYQEITSNNFV